MTVPKKSYFIKESIVIKEMRVRYDKNRKERNFVR